MIKTTKKQILVSVLLIISMVLMSSYSFYDEVRANPIPGDFIELSGEEVQYILTPELTHGQIINLTVVVSEQSKSDVYFGWMQPRTTEISWTPSPPSNFTLAPSESINISSTLISWKGMKASLDYSCSLGNTTSNATVLYYYTILDVTGVPGFDVAIWLTASIATVGLFTIIRKKKNNR